MDEYQVLSNELATDPLGRGYTTMTHAQIVDSLNGLTRPDRVPIRDLLGYAVRASIYSRLEDDASNVTSSSRGVSRKVMALLKHSAEFPYLNLADPDVIASLNALETNGVITPTEKAAVLAMANNRRSRAQELGIGGWVTEGRVLQARGG